MKYVISSRDSWDINMIERFGALGEGRTLELNDTEVVQAIILCGRAVITELKDGTRELKFEVEYD